MFRLKIMLPMLYHSIKSGNRRFMLQMIGYPMAMSLGMMLIFSLKAAVISLSVYAGIVLATLVYIIFSVDYMAEITLKPSSFRASVNLKAVEKLAEELIALGFVPAGTFIAKTSHVEMAIEGWAHINLRVYAMIAAGNKTTNPFVEFYSYYADGGFFSVNGAKMKATLPTPANVVRYNYHGQTTATLWEIFLRNRPAGIIFETPQDRFQAAAEYAARLHREYIQKLKDGLV